MGKDGGDEGIRAQWGLNTERHSPSGGLGAPLEQWGHADSGGQVCRALFPGTCGVGTRAGRDGCKG